MTDKKKILFAINSLAGGGAERVLTTLLRASEGWCEHYDLHLALLDDEPRAYPVPNFVNLIQLDARFRLLPSLLQMRALVRSLQPDASLSFLTRANVANAFAMAGSGKPWLISERVNTSAHLGTGRGALAARTMVRMAYPRAHRIIAVSTGVVADLVENFGVSRARIVAIANPIDHDSIERSAGEPPAFRPDGPFIAAAGRLVPNKNFSMLIDAFAKADLPAHLVIFGDGPERGALEAQAQSLGIADRVHMPGFVDNPFAVLTRSQLFAMPSNAEGFPNGLVEAMACGLPVVATNCASGPSEILAGLAREDVDGPMDLDCGALVPPNDADCFADALRRVYAAGRIPLGYAARRRSLQFGVEQAAANYWREIESVLNGQAPADRADEEEPLKVMAGVTG